MEDEYDEFAAASRGIGWRIRTGPDNPRGDSGS
jgi:hypothetical protein